MRMLLKISRMVAAAAVIIALSLLAWQCLALYAAGSDDANRDANGLYIRPIYTREDVMSRLDSVSVPLAACAGAVILAIVLHAAVPHQPDAFTGMTPENRLRLLKSRVTSLPEAAQKEERLRSGLTLISGAVMVGLCGYCLFYLLNRESFPEWNRVRLDLVMGTMLLHIVPPSAFALLLGIALSFVRKASAEREIVILQGLPKTDSAVSLKAPKNTNRVRVILYVAAVAFILLGVMNGGLRDVLYKAINICTECIGLG